VWCVCKCKCLYVCCLKDLVCAVCVSGKFCVWFCGYLCLSVFDVCVCVRSVFMCVGVCLFFVCMVCACVLCVCGMCECVCVSCLACVYVWSVFVRYVCGVCVWSVCV